MKEKSFYFRLNLKAFSLVFHLEIEIKKKHYPVLQVDIYQEQVARLASSREYNQKACLDSLRYRYVGFLCVLVTIEKRLLLAT